MFVARDHSACAAAADIREIGLGGQKHGRHGEPYII